MQEMRVLMCTKRVERFVHIYGEPHDVPLVLDPSYVSYTEALINATTGTFFGSYCAECEEKVEGKTSPGLQIGDAVLCRSCAHEADEAVLGSNLTIQLGGAEIEPRAWAVLKLETDMSVRQTRAEFNFAYKRNMAVVEDLWRRFHELRLDDPD
jgi:hypothetical protein